MVGSVLEAAVVAVKKAVVPVSGIARAGLWDPYGVRH